MNDDRQIRTPPPVEDDPRPLKVLMAEDCENDALLVLRQLRKDGFEPTHVRVDDPEAMARALERGEWDIILSDYSMPQFTAPDALKLMKDRGLDLPFIVISGTMGESTAVATMRAGAHDYLMKGSLGRLGEAIRREMLAAKARLERGRYTEQLQHLNSVLRAIRDINQLIVKEREPNKLIDDACELLVEARGYNAAWIALGDGQGPPTHFAGAGWGPAFEGLAARLRQGGWPSCGERALGQDACVFIRPAEVCGECPLALRYGSSDAAVSALRHGDAVHGLLGVSFPQRMSVDDQERSLLAEIAGDLAFAVHDIESERLRAESEARFRVITESSADAIFITDPEGHYVYVNDKATELLGYTTEALTQMSVADGSTPEARERDLARFGEILEHGALAFETTLAREDGSTVPVDLNAVVLPNGLVYGSCRDITARKRSEHELRQFQWLLEKEAPGHDASREPYEPPYSDVTELNTARLVLEAAGKSNLAEMGRDLMDLLDTSVAVYESNGDHAHVSFDSQWCRLLDSAAFALCRTDSTTEALGCGEWLCHECCWHESARTAMASGAPTDIECVGGLRLYAVPIRAGEEIVGAINIGYGTPLGTSRPSPPWRSGSSSIPRRCAAPHATTSRARSTSSTWPSGAASPSRGPSARPSNAAGPKRCCGTSPTTCPTWSRWPIRTCA